MPPTNDPAAVDAYLGALGAERRGALEHVREIIRATAPGATERISYRIPVFALHGDLVGLSAHARHLSLHTMSPGLVSAMAARLAGVRVSGATIHFTERDPLPDGLVAEIVDARVAENLARKSGGRPAA